jgi:hypothetical protein
VACQDGNPCTVATCSGNACAFVGNQGVACSVQQFGAGICDATGSCCASDNSSCFRLCATDADCRGTAQPFCSFGQCQPSAPL